MKAFFLKTFPLHVSIKAWLTIKLGWKTGFEPATSGITIRCSNQLSYFHHRNHRFPGSTSSRSRDSVLCDHLSMPRPVLIGWHLPRTVCVAGPGSTTAISRGKNEVRSENSDLCSTSPMNAGPVPNFLDNRNCRDRSKPIDT